MTYIHKTILLKFMTNVFIMALSFITFSCSSKKSIEDKISGMWMIQEILYQDTSYKDSLAYNMIFFKKENNQLTVKLPEISKYSQEIATWKIEDNGNFYVVQINSKNKIFNKNLRISFVKEDEKKLLGAVFTQKDLVMTAYKLQTEYDIDGLYWMNE